MRSAIGRGRRSEGGLSSLARTKAGEIDDFGVSYTETGIAWCRSGADTRGDASSRRYAASNATVSHWSPLLTLSGEEAS